MCRRDELAHDDLDIGVVPTSGAPVPPNIKAVESADSFYGLVDAVETSAPAGSVAVTTSTATPIDTAIRVATAKAPTRLTYLPCPIRRFLPSRAPGLRLGHRSQRAFSKLLAEAYVPGPASPKTSLSV